MSEEPDPEFRIRIEQVIERAGGPKSLSERSGVSLTQLHQYRKGSEPSRPKLIAMARVAGVRVAWLATGELPMEEGAPRTAEVIRDFLDTGSEEARSLIVAKPETVLDHVVNMDTWSGRQLLEQLYGGIEEAKWALVHDPRGTLLQLRSGRPGNAPATAGPPPPAVTEQLIVDAVVAVEEWLEAHRRTLAAEKKGRVIAILIEDALDQAVKGQPTVDRGAAAKLLRVAG